MKSSKMHYIVIVLFSITCWTVCEDAESAESTSQPASIQLRKDISKYDINRNGRLDPNEQEAMLRDLAQQREAEHAARAQAAVENAKAAAAERYARQKISPKLLEKYDANKNGKMDPQEWKRHRQDIIKLREAKLAAGQPTTSQPPAPVSSTNSSAKP